MEDDGGFVCGLKLRKLKTLTFPNSCRINNMLCAVLHPLTTPDYPDPSYSMSDPHAAHSQSQIFHSAA